MRIPHFDGLYGEPNARPSASYLFSELLETRSPTFDWVIKPHIHTQLFQLFCLKTGQLRFQDALGYYDMAAPCLVFIPPVSQHGLTYSPDTTGHILTISDSLIESLFPATSAIGLTLNRICRINEFGSVYRFTDLLGLIEQIDRELFGDQPEKQMMLEAYLRQLWIKLYRIMRASEEQQQTAHTPTLDHFRRFQQSIRQSEYPKSIPEFANELQVSAVHLNRICQAVVGKSALELVQEHLVQEAKKYLIYTSYSISEIAYLLNFEYPNYFAKLFKKYTGLSPKEFREAGKSLR